MSDADPKQESTTVATVEVSDDQMMATIVVNEPASDCSEPLAPRDIMKVVAQAGIRHGLVESAVESIIERKTWGEKVIIAECEPPVPGENARLEFSFPTTKSLKPKRDQDGNVDYREVSLVHSAEKDAQLVRKIPAKPGRPGINVLGNEVAAICGKDVFLAAGEGTYVDAEDDSIVRAATDGVIYYNRRTKDLEVKQLYSVRGSVDFSTGNIHVRSAVEVSEDVKAGFSVTTPYDVGVRGVVEHAEIICGGSLTVGAGITGDGERKIDVGCDLTSVYIHNQPIRCRGNVNVDAEIRNAIIECDGEVVVKKGNGVIIGGQIAATNKVSAAFIGNENHQPTEIEVGVNAEMRDAYLQKVAEKNELVEHIDELREQAAFVVRKFPKTMADARLSPIKEKWQEYNVLLQQSEGEVKDLHSAYYSAEAPEICVSGTIFPGTRICISGNPYEVSNVLSGVRFSLVGANVDCTPLR